MNKHFTTDGRYNAHVKILHLIYYIILIKLI